MEFSLEIILPVPPQKVYESWLDSEAHSEMTGGDALITDDVGDKFTAWDGYIWGTNLELIPHKFIKQTWRTSEFADDQENSIIEIHLKAHGDDGTQLTLNHYDLTENDHQYKQGWEDHYFTPMLAYFSG